MTKQRSWVYYSQRLAIERGVIKPLHPTFVKAFSRFVSILENEMVFPWGDSKDDGIDYAISEQLDVTLFTLHDAGRERGSISDAHVLDLVEFCHLHIDFNGPQSFGGEKIEASEIRKLFRAWVNDRFEQASHPYLLRDDGTVVTHPSPVMDEFVWGTELPTDDPILREHLIQAQKHFYSRSAGPQGMHDALSRLAGALERVKTRPDRNKAKGAGIISRLLASRDNDLAQLLDTYLGALTKLSHAGVRHVEHGSPELDSDLREFMFYTMFAYLRVALRRLSREGFVELEATEKPSDEDASE